MLDLLFLRTWWRWEPDPGGWHWVVVHWFNLFEAAVWFLLGALVLRRFLLNRRSRWELVYTAAFVLFGVTDVIESFRVTSWPCG